jgi:addiction module HigA family antidote
MNNGMRPVHPGEILREDYLVPLKMSANALAKRLGVTAPRVTDIVNEKRGITPETALRLAVCFGGDAQSWMNLQTMYDLKIAQKETMKKILKEVTPLNGTNAAGDERFALAA